MRTPQCRHVAGAQCPAVGATTPIRSPRATADPTATRLPTGSYDVRTPPECVTTTTPRPATGPAKVTRPPPADRTGCPTAAARSTPRWPALHGVGGARNSATTAGSGSSGQPHVPAGERVAGSGQADARAARADQVTSGGGPAAALVGAARAAMSRSIAGAMPRAWL